VSIQLTIEEHKRVVENLLGLPELIDVDKIKEQEKDISYVSLMMCFMLHNISSAETLNAIYDNFGEERFPVTVGFVIVRSMFETEITSHYISQNPKKRAEEYIQYEAILNKKQMDSCFKHRNSKKESWKEAMTLEWENYWKEQQNKIDSKYNFIRKKYEFKTKQGKLKQFKNWSNKTIKEMAVKVDHKEAYDVFYAHLSSFTHADVRLANSFLRLSPGKISWSVSHDEVATVFVFKYAATFLTCFFELFSEQFNLWSKQQVLDCWNVK
jgi:hypothetical protein